jgi:hypothetical protein
MNEKISFTKPPLPDGTQAKEILYRQKKRDLEEIKAIESISQHPLKREKAP